MKITVQKIGRFLVCSFLGHKSKDLKNIREKYWGHIIQECVFCGKRKIKAKNFKWEKSNEIHTTTILVPYLK